MIRVGDLTLFHPLEGGELAVFSEDRPRTVRFTFNAPQETVVNVIDVTPKGEVPKGAEPVFLAVVHGLEDVEFYAQGAFALSCEADRIYVRTIDGQHVHAVVPDAETFTRIQERRVRNPEIERLQAMLLENQERRMGALMNEVRLEREALTRERAALADDLATRAPGGGGEPQVPAGAGAGASSGSPPPDGVGSEGSGSDA